MSPTYSALLVIGLMVGIGLPVLYWVFFKMDNQDAAVGEHSSEPTDMDDSDLDLIENKLDVRLPENLRNLLSNRSLSSFDNTTLLDDPGAIIEATILYRDGFEGLSRWPKNLLYLGDEADACPYVIDTQTSQVMRLDKGDLDKRPIESFSNVTEWMDYEEKSS